MVNNKYVSLKMPNDLLNQIDAKANQEMLSRSDIIRKALLFYFKHENSVK